jgi:thaumarchaeosortase
MPKITEATKKNIVNFLRKLLPIFAFIIPFIILYHLDPKTFEATWKGRTYYLFFLWLFAIETILSGEEIHPEKRKLKSIKTFVFVIVLSLPTMYVIVTNYFGWNKIIANLAEKSGVQLAYDMPLSTEYLVFMVIFTAILILEYGISNLKNYAISTIFLGTIGMIYSVDNLYPYGRFTPFQIIVPTTTMLSANVLNLMGYHTLWLGISSGLPTLIAWDSHGNYSSPFSIGWPCSGVESLLLYTVTILLFLKKSAISWKHGIIYFTIGAIVTYFINILRIATFFIISINHGDITTFHNYYGQLYSITWIISYPLIIIGNQLLWSKIKSWRTRGLPESLTRSLL